MNKLYDPIKLKLNKVLNTMRQYVENIYEHDSEPMLNWKDIKLVLDEIERLNNIINTFEEEIEVELTFEDKDCLLEHNTFITIHDTLEKVLKRIKELKEGK